jgi:hypothetical protein
LQDLAAQDGVRENIERSDGQNIEVTTPNGDVIDPGVGRESIKLTARQIKTVGIGFIDKKTFATAGKNAAHAIGG